MGFEFVPQISTDIYRDLWFVHTVSSVKRWSEVDHGDLGVAVHSRDGRVEPFVR